MSTKHPATHDARAMRKLMMNRLSSMALVRSPERPRHAGFGAGSSPPRSFSASRSLRFGRAGEEPGRGAMHEHVRRREQREMDQAANWSDGHVPTQEEVVCIPRGITASLWFMTEVPAFVSVRAIRGGSVFSNTGSTSLGRRAKPRPKWKNLPLRARK